MSSDTSTGPGEISGDTVDSNDLPQLTDLVFPGEKIKVFAVFQVQESREDIDLELYMQTEDDPEPVIQKMVIPRIIDDPTWADVLALAQQGIPKSVFCFATPLVAEGSVERFQAWFLKACELVTNNTLASSFENG